MKASSLALVATAEGKRSAGRLRFRCRASMFKAIACCFKSLVLNRTEAIGPAQFLGWGQPTFLAMRELRAFCMSPSISKAAGSVAYLLILSECLNTGKSQMSIMNLAALRLRWLFLMQKKTLQKY
jgi:hypothetical protein